MTTRERFGKSKDGRGTIADIQLRARNSGIERDDRILASMETIELERYISAEKRDEKSDMYKMESKELSENLLNDSAEITE